MLRLWLVLVLAFSGLPGCQPVPAVSPRPLQALDASDGGSASAEVRVVLPRRLLALGPTSGDDVGTVVLTLHRVEGGEELLRATLVVPRAALGQPVALRHMRADATYRLSGEAYLGSSPVPAGRLTDPTRPDVVEWAVGHDEAPVVPPLVLRLADTEAVVVSTVRQGYWPGGTEGYARERALAGPVGVAVAADGTIFVAEESGHRVLRLSPGGLVSTYVGTGSPGSADGTGAAAGLDQPQGLALAPDGTLYVSESGFVTGGHRIRKVSPAGVVTTLAGGARGWQDGAGAQARFSNPRGLALGPDGTLYVADQWNHRIRTVSPNGVVATLAGTGSGGLTDGVGVGAALSYPTGVAWGPDGALYVADTGNRAVRRVTPAGVVTTVAGPGQGGEAPFADPVGIAVAGSGDVFVGDGAVLRKVTPDGAVTLVAGGAPGHRDGAPAHARFQALSGLAVAPGGGMVACDSLGSVRRLTALLEVSTVAGIVSEDGTGRGVVFSSPRGLRAEPGGALLLADTFAHRIRSVTPAGQVSTLAGWDAGDADGAATDARLYRPEDAVRAPDGGLYIADTANHKIRRLTPGGEVVTVAGGAPGFADGPGATAQFWTPKALALAADGTLYVADGDNHCLRKITFGSEGPQVSTLAGSAPDGEGFADGVGPAARFAYPTGLALRPDGALYVADCDNHRLRVVTPDGTVTTLAGSEPGLADGLGAAARFNEPVRVAVDPGTGLVYVSDQANHAVRRVTPEGHVRTIAGGTEGLRDGVGASARFSRPAGLAVAPDGSLYVADEGNGVVRRLR
ncbi:MAG: hypothetical protein VKS61_16540 [Candidatus Sericytochromatia bacterium]|nr:hypothetical protein [Candidatus Sericytochromatia bacterium]